MSTVLWRSFLDNPKKLSEKKRRLTGRILEHCGAIDHDITDAFEKYFEGNAYTYFALEEKLLDMRRLFETLQHQVSETQTMAELGKLAERVGFVEDRLDEMESKLYNRRRRKRRFSFADFFNQYREQIGSGAEREVGSLQEAYTLLGLKGGEGMLEVTATFRRFAKKYHPDARGGDRSCEMELRRAVGAYQYIKQNFAKNNRP